MSDQNAAHLARLATIDGPPLPLDARVPCRHEPDMWFPDKGGSHKPTELAKETCRRCPWRVDCFTWAADPDNQVSHGIWGGFSFGRFSPDEDFITAYRAAVWPQPQPKENEREATTAA